MGFIRSLFSTGSYRFLAALTAIILGVVFLFFVSIIPDQKPQNATVAQGSVLTATADLADDSCNVQAAFRVDGKRFLSQSKRASGEFCSYKKGDLIEVQYNSLDPQDNVILAGESNLRIVFVILPILFIIGGTLALLQQGLMLLRGGSAKKGRQVKFNPPEPSLNQTPPPAPPPVPGPSLQPGAQAGGFAPYQPEAPAPAYQPPAQGAPPVPLQPAHEMPPAPPQPHHATSQPHLQPTQGMQPSLQPAQDISPPPPQPAQGISPAPLQLGPDAPLPHPSSLQPAHEMPPEYPSQPAQMPLPHHATPQPPLQPAQDISQPAPIDPVQPLSPQPSPQAQEIAHQGPPAFSPPANAFSGSQAQEPVDPQASLPSGLTPVEIEAPSPGWYNAPDGSVRWWDGQQWTSQTR